MMSPVFRGLKEKYGRSCEVTVALDTAYMAGVIPAIFQGNPFIDQMVRVDPYDFAPFALRWFRGEWHRQPREGQHIPHCFLETDLVIDLNVICSIVETRQQPHVTSHRTDIWCEAAGVNPSCKKPIFVLDRAERAEGADWTDRHVGEGTRIGIVLNAHSPVRTWPYACAFARRLQEQGHRVVTIDSVKRVSDEIPALIGKNIRQVGAVLENLDLVISPDSGLLHLAGAVGTPVIGLFGSTDGRMRMREYAGSYTIADRLTPCGPCWYTLPCLRKHGNGMEPLACMNRISMDLVQHELEATLARFGRR